MPNFNPIAPNFYTKQINRPSTAGLSAVQNAGARTNGNNFSARGTQNRALPGIKNNGVNFTTPNPNYKGLIGAAAAGAVAGLIDSAINPAYNAGYPGYYNPSLYDPSITRLYNNNLPYGGTYDNSGRDGSLPQDNFVPVTTEPDASEDRVLIKDQTNLFIGKAAVFAPLQRTNGLLFPFTPTIAVTHSASYELESLLHTNYATPYYTNSVVNNINIQGKFSAQTEEEGQYVMAVIHFLRTVTKMFYGASSNKGTPPPVLFLDAHGQYMFDHIPVVVKEFQYTLPNDVNYITAKVNGLSTRIPTEMNITVDLIPTYSRNKISNQFDLIKFSTGSLLTSGTGYRSGGWI